jgi:hypothetical protein
MAILKKSTECKKEQIDLTGPEGNAMFLIGRAVRWGGQLGLDVPKVREEMMAGDYENLILVFDKYFGEVCDLVR